MSNPEKNSNDFTIVSRRRVACDGGGGALGHPKTWLDMGQGNQVECKYCDKVFKLDSSEDLDSVH